MSQIIYISILKIQDDILINMIAIFYLKNNITGKNLIDKNIRKNEIRSKCI